MEPFQLLASQADKSYKTADHLAYVTYPLVNDKKLLLVIFGNLYHAISYGLEALLSFEAFYKRIGSFPQSFESRLFIVKRSFASRYNISPYFLATAQEVHEIMMHRETSPIEFVRKDKFIIASENFQLKTVTIGTVKSHLASTKQFINTLKEAFATHDRRPR